VMLACESLGVRSLCARVGELLIDPGAALGPKRYGLPPHGHEHRALRESLERIRGELDKVECAVISHYHYDHYMPEGDYSGKKLFLKDWENNINKSQRERAAAFLKRLERQDVEVVRADGQDLGWAEFSPAFPHGGEGSRLGWVIYTHTAGIVHASDAQGPRSEEAAEWIVERAPGTLILSGFPTYLAGWRVSYDDLDLSNRLLCRIIEAGTEQLVLDHHLLRDSHYRRRIGPVLECAEEHGARVMTGADAAGQEPLLLEAFRKELHAGRGLDEVRRMSKEATG